MELSEKDMYNELPIFITDPSNQAKVEALLAGRQNEVVEREKTRQIGASL